MIGIYVLVKFVFFGPGLEEKKEAKRRSIFARTRSHIVYLAMSHMSRSIRDSVLDMNVGLHELLHGMVRTPPCI